MGNPGGQLRAARCSPLGIAAATLNNKTISGALTGVALGVKRGEGHRRPPMRKAGVLPAPGPLHLLTGR